MWIEAIGYAASLLVAASLMMSNVKHLRWINLAGAVAFTVYGALVGAWPVFGVNLFVTAVDVYYLDRMARQRDFFTLLEVESGSAYLKKFLRFYERDIQRFFPGARFEAMAAARGYFVLRNMLPVGAFLYLEREGGVVEILLDYVIPEYRDRKNADFVFRILNEQFSREGKTEFRIASDVPAHTGYLLREGFRETGKGWFTRPII